MIRLLKPLNWKGDILPVGTEIGLGDLEEKLIESGAAERIEAVKKESEGPSEDYKALLEAFEQSQNTIAELQSQLSEKDKLIIELQDQASKSESDETPQVTVEELQVTVEELPKEEPPKETSVGRTKK